MFGRKKKDKRSDDRIAYGIGFEIDLLNLQCDELEKERDAFVVLSSEEQIEKITKDMKVLRDRKVSEKVLSAIDEKFQKTLQRFEGLTK